MRGRKRSAIEIEAGHRRLDAEQWIGRDDRPVAAESESGAVGEKRAHCEETLDARVAESRECLARIVGLVERLHAGETSGEARDVARMQRLCVLEARRGRVGARVHRVEEFAGSAVADGVNAG